MNYNSLPTCEEKNLEKYWEVIRKLDPQLYLIKIALTESGINPEIIPPIIRTLGNLAIGTGYGKIQIFMQARVITQIKPEESVEINREAIIDIDKK